jgi:hypothetical protein
MRTIPSPSFVLACVLASSTLAVDQALGQAELQLLTFTNTWKYYLTNAYGPEGSWTSTNYDDSSWLVGLPLFGYDDAILPLPFNSLVDPPSRGGPATLYFRTRFDFPSNPAPGMSLVASNLVDDGAVFYLNGTEMRRIRMPAGVVAYGTFANGTVGDATAYDVFTIPASGSSIRIGDNVLAAEVHNVNVTSSDTVFAMSLTAVIPIPIAIVQQPQSQVTSEGTPVTFTVTVTGSNPYYRWYRKPSPVVQSFGRSLTNNNPTLASAGEYYVVITNSVSIVTSEVAVLTVLKDVFPPGLRSAIAQDSGSSNTILGTFTESVLSLSATNATNYLIAQAGTTNRVLVSVALPSQNTVWLTVDPVNWIWGRDYLLTVTHVADTRANYMSPLSNQIAVTFPQLLLGWNGTSLCWDDFGASLQTPPVELSTNWMQPDLDDRSPLWFPVLGIAYADRDPTEALCAERRDGLDYASFVPRYFRGHFMAPASSGNAWIRLRHVVDDGAVFYLNGQEVHRINMPAGAIDPTTTAISSVGPRCYETSFLTEDFRTGDNVLAVEVHRSSDLQAIDVYYGVQITATLLPDPIVIQPPRLTIVPAEGDTVRLDWPADTGLDWTLEATANLTSGPWVPVATSPPFQTNVAPGAAQFFRLRGPGPF